MLEAKVIEKCYGPWTSPVVIVEKKDGKPRFCVDYRRLNAVTKRDVFPLKRIEEIFDALHGVRYFSTLDIFSGFWQIEVATEDREKTGFTTEFGNFQFCRLPFGLTGSPASFVRMMEMVLAGLEWENCLIYVDDTVVYRL